MVVFLAIAWVLSLGSVLHDVAYQQNGGAGCWVSCLYFTARPINQMQKQTSPQQLCASNPWNGPAFYKHSTGRPSPDKTSTYSWRSWTPPPFPISTAYDHQNISHRVRRLWEEQTHWFSTTGISSWTYTISKPNRNDW